MVEGHTLGTSAGTGSCEDTPVAPLGGDPDASGPGPGGGAREVRRADRGEPEPVQSERAGDYARRDRAGTGVWRSRESVVVELAARDAGGTVRGVQAALPR